MKKKEPRSLQDILTDQPSSVFKRLADLQSKNDTLLALIRAVLTSQFSQHLVAVTYREEILVLVADTPAWANRLRFESENIRKMLIEQGHFITSKSDDSDSSDGNLPALRKIVTRTAANEIPDTLGDNKI